MDAFFAWPHCAFKQRAGTCQPWFYLRLVAYGFVGLSEGAYGGPETSPLKGVAYPDGGYSPSNPSAQCQRIAHTIISHSDRRCALKLLLTSDARRRTFLLSSKSSGQ